MRNSSTRLPENKTIYNGLPISIYLMNSTPSQPRHHLNRETRIQKTFKTMRTAQDPAHPLPSRWHPAAVICLTHHSMNGFATNKRSTRSRSFHFRAYDSLYLPNAQLHFPNPKKKKEHREFAPNYTPRHSDVAK